MILRDTNIISELMRPQPNQAVIECKLIKTSLNVMINMTAMQHRQYIENQLLIITPFK